jgi:hypothetical protein
MYFRLIDHYPDDQDFMEDEPLELNECLICLEINTPDNLKSINLKTQQIYFKKCDCGGWVHISCLCEWHEISKSCPICRIYMTKYESIISIFSLNFVNYYSKCLLAIIRLCFIIWFLFALSCSYHIYKSYFTLKNRSVSDKGQPITE